jgi:hypothetical protein
MKNIKIISLIGTASIFLIVIAIIVVVWSRNTLLTNTNTNSRGDVTTAVDVTQPQVTQISATEKEYVVPVLIGHQEKKFKVKYPTSWQEKYEVKDDGQNQDFTLTKDDAVIKFSRGNVDGAPCRESYSGEGYVITYSKNKTTGISAPSGEYIIFNYRSIDDQQDEYAVCGPSNYNMPYNTLTKIGVIGVQLPKIVSSILFQEVKDIIGSIEILN